MNLPLYPAVLFALVGVASGVSVNGAISLDNSTIDKILSKLDMDLLVRLDKEQTFGDELDAFKRLCQSAIPAPNLLVGSVEVSNYGDKQNDGLRERFNVAVESFPAYLLFRKGALHSRYSGEIRVQKIMTWLRGAGVRGLKAEEGTIEELNILVTDFVARREADGLSVIEETDRVVAELYSEDKKAQLYPRVMRKIASKGPDYVDTETARLGKLVEEGQKTMSLAKLAEMDGKLTILGVFAEALSVAVKNEEL